MKVGGHVSTLLLQIGALLETLDESGLLLDRDDLSENKDGAVD